MKKALIVLIVILFTVSVRAQQWTTSGANIYNSNTGNVGIGTSSPELPIHILGPIGFPVASGTVQTSILRLQGVTSNGVLDIGVSGGNGASFQATNRSNLALYYPLIFNPNGGNVGIGTITPASTLSIKGGYGINIEPASGSPLHFYIATNSADNIIGVNARTKSGTWEIPDNSKPSTFLDFSTYTVNNPYDSS